MSMPSQHFAKLWQEKKSRTLWKKNSSNFIVPLKRLDQLHQNNNLLTLYNKYYKETSFCLPNINLLSFRKLRCVLCLKWQNKNKLRFLSFHLKRGNLIDVKCSLCESSVSSHSTHSQKHKIDCDYLVTSRTQAMPHQCN